MAFQTPRQYPQHPTIDESLSGGSSVDSQIDFNDNYRMGGPGMLPQWPIREAPPSNNFTANLGEHLVRIASKNLHEMQIDYYMISVRQRSPVEHPPTPADDTLYIQTRSLPSSPQLWVTFLDRVIQTTRGIGFRGRVEIIESRAMAGRKSFPPNFPREGLQFWEDVKERVESRLAAINFKWNMIMAANRGYTSQDARFTLLVKTQARVPRETIANAQNELYRTVDSPGVEFEVVYSNALWGIFSRYTDIGVQFSTFGSPFRNPENELGKSVSRASSPGTGTVGGYLTIENDNDRDHVIAMTCCHVIRKEFCGIVHLTSKSTGQGFECQSPSADDIKTATNNARKRAYLQSHANPRIERNRQEAAEVLKIIKDFNPHFGSVVAMSGFRNKPLDETDISSPLMMMDWALIDVTNNRRSYNTIEDFAVELSEAGFEDYPDPNVQSVKDIGSLPRQNTVVFKKGRATNVTAGIVGPVVPADVQIDGLPEHLHQRGFVIYSQLRMDEHQNLVHMPFSGPGDSGAWCINAEGLLVGHVIGGDYNDGSGLLIPMQTTIQDIEGLARLKKGTVRVLNNG